MRLALQLSVWRQSKVLRRRRLRVHARSHLGVSVPRSDADRSKTVLVGRLPRLDFLLLVLLDAFLLFLLLLHLLLELHLLLFVASLLTLDVVFNLPLLLKHHELKPPPLAVDVLTLKLRHPRVEDGCENADLVVEVLKLIVELRVLALVLRQVDGLTDILRQLEICLVPVFFDLAALRTVFTLSDFLRDRNDIVGGGAHWRIIGEASLLLRKLLQIVE